MGKLTNLSSIKDNADWYFPDAYYSNRGWMFDWPNPAFPFSFAIHFEDLHYHGDRKILIRKWIEEKIQSTVIVHNIDRSYRVYFNRWEWDRSFERPNRWYVFYFEDNESALLFKIAFSEYIRPITDLHPDGQDIYENTSYNQNNS